MEQRITLSRQDLMGLRAVMSTRFATRDREYVDALEDEIARAFVVDASELPSDVVALNSRVLVRDLESSLCNAYTIVSPALADADRGSISVLAPLGMALIGQCKGDEVQWQMPMGTRRLKIEAVMQRHNRERDVFSPHELAIA
jgi:regulator of nucleoside diphosphate kinase